MTASTCRLDGRVALISGVATGMGRAGARLFADEGAAVVGLDLDEDRGRATIDDVIGQGGTATFVPGDAAASRDVARAVAVAVRQHGKLDCLWANAGIGVFKDALATSEEEWDRVLAVNLKGVYLMAHHGIPEVIRAGGGTMVATGSVNSTVAAPRWAAYSASKGGVLMLCRALALDHAPDNVRVNCICPGSIDTPLLDAAMRASDAPYAAAVAADVADHPLGRVGHADEVALAALFLSCDESSYVTGSALAVDGGFTAR